MKKRKGFDSITYNLLHISYLRNWLYPILLTLAKPRIKYNIKILNDLETLSGKSIIFVANHSSATDLPIVAKITKRRSYVLVGKQNMPLSDRIFLHLNGVVWVDRKSKKEMAECKKILLEYLSHGQSIIWFPEGTWNLTSNLLMLPMKWGVVEVAHQADAQIIPMALSYDRDKNLCLVRFGTPLSGDDLSDKCNGIRMLRDAMATLCWKIMENTPILSRVDTDPEELKKEVEIAIAEYPALDWAYESSCIYSPPNCILDDKADGYWDIFN